MSSNTGLMRWHEVLSEYLWLIIPKLLILIRYRNAYRLAKQNDLSTIMYHDLMMDNIDEVTDKRMKALKDIERDKS